MKVLDDIYWYPEGGFFDCNSYFIDDEIHCLIDPGNLKGLNDLIQKIEDDGFSAEEIDLIINTHSHPDHSMASPQLKKISNSKICLSKEEKDFVNSVPQRIFQTFTNSFGGTNNLKVDTYLADELNTGSLDWKIIQTPGHTSGSVSLYSEELKVLISGDVIFEGSVGRTDLPGGSSEELKQSIQLLSKLDVVHLLPGHGRIIQGKEAIERNFEHVGRFLESVF